MSQGTPGTLVGTLIRELSIVGLKKEERKKKEPLTSWKKQLIH